jgi:hypothetical protein
MNVEDGAEIVRDLVERGEPVVAERQTVHVAEHHRSGQTELLHRSLELLRRGRLVVQRQRGERREMRSARVHGLLELVVDQRRQSDGRRRRLHVRTRRRQGEDLHRHAVLVQDFLPVAEIAMAAHGDIEIARVMEHRIAVGVDGHSDAALAGLQCQQVLRRIEVAMKVDDAHAGGSIRNTRADLRRPAPGR